MARGGEKGLSRARSRTIPLLASPGTAGPTLNIEWGGGGGGAKGVSPQKQSFPLLL